LGKKDPEPQSREFDPDYSTFIVDQHLNDVMRRQSEKVTEIKSQGRPVIENVGELHQV
jgi:hypothetical protein